MMRTRRGVALWIIPLLPIMASDAHAAIVISAKPTSNVSCSGGVCSPTARDATLNVSDLEAMLASSSVTVTTAGATASNLIVSASLSWTSASGLTLDAYDSVEIEEPVADSGPGSLSLLTNDGGSGGALRILHKGKVAFLGTANPLTINGSAYVLVSSISDLATDIAANPKGFYALANNYNARPDGTYSGSPITAFSGTLDGLGNTIFNLKIRAGRGIKEVGLIGEFQGKLISHVGLTHATVTGGGSAHVGALVARNHGLLFEDTADAQVRGRWAGALVGESDAGTIEDSSSSGTVAGVGKFGIAGGLVGALSKSVVEESWSTASASSADYIAGGLVGVNEGTVMNDYATGTVSGTTSTSEAGGLIGNVDFGADSTSYSAGAVTGMQWVGGYVGYVSDDGGFTDCYWNTTTSGTDQGSGDGNDIGVTGLTTSQLQSGLPAGFDPSIWAEKASINNGLPYLIDNPPPT